MYGFQILHPFVLRFFLRALYIISETGVPNWGQIDQLWVRDDQNKYELTYMSTSWPNNEDELTKWVRIDQIDENELAKMRTNWLKYELTGNR